MQEAPPTDRTASSALKALSLLATRLGINCDVEQLRRRFAVGSGEPSTATLIAMARDLGLEAQAIHMKFKDLPRLGRSLPAILRAKDGGALILEDARSDPARGTVAIIRDPGATDEAVLAIDELHLASPSAWRGSRGRCSGSASCSATSPSQRS
jgi:ABC-type bacteriocin/lantibiotic exporter with double-glycine peptidase domain